MNITALTVENETNQPTNTDRLSRNGIEAKTTNTAKQVNVIHPLFVVCPQTHADTRTPHTARAVRSAITKPAREQCGRRQKKRYRMIPHHFNRLNNGPNDDGTPAAPT